MGHHHSHRRSELSGDYWKSSQAYGLAVITLILGGALGYLYHGSSTSVRASGPSSEYSDTSSTSLQASSLQTPSTVQVLLDQLKDKPNDPGLLANIGNQYYDNRDYSKAIEYYQKSLKLKPEDVNVRTDMGTAMWYSGDADGALREYQKSLKYEPNHAQTLFNMGVVEWQGKHDSKSAIEVWRQLLAANPGYSDRPKVEEMIQQASSTTP